VSRATAASPFCDEIHLVAEVAGVEHDFPRLKMLASHDSVVKKPELRDVARQEDIQNPIRTSRNCPSSPGNFVT
jgi:hypothetical protein